MCNGGFSVRSARSSASSSSFLNCGSCSATQLFTNVATSTATEVSILTSSIASARAPQRSVAKSSHVTLASDGGPLGLNGTGGCASCRDGE